MSEANVRVSSAVMTKSALSSEEADHFQKRGTSVDLVVLIHGYRGSPSGLTPVMAALSQISELANADFLAPRLPFNTFSHERPVDAVASVVDGIDKCFERRRKDGAEYRRIYLLGHSVGGVFVRRAYVCASGTHPEAPMEKDLLDAFRSIGAEVPDQERPWAKRVERIVLLAALNRGWSVSQHMGLLSFVIWTVGDLIGRFRGLFLSGRPLIFGLRKGSPFIAQLRIQWIRMRQRAADDANAAGGAVTIQLLGSVDDLVSPTDSVDIVSGRDFYYIDVPYSSHRSLLEMDGDSPEQRGRRECLVRAITEPAAELDRSTSPPVDETFEVFSKVTDVVFVIHGIRDVGYWTQKIARRTIELGRKSGRVVVPETSSYGYFPMLPFIWPGTRRRKVEWLMDEYTEAVARYPNARFAYMGHSNGTYLLARALKEYPVVRFTNVVFVGSVVVTYYDWRSVIEEGRVNRVLNYTASGDMVVAFFPKVFQRPRTQDLGSAGHDGFEQSAAEGVLQLGPVRGGHSAARQEPEWDAIAEFLMNGSDVGTNNASPGRSRLVAVLSWVPGVVWIVLLGLIALGFWGLTNIADETWRVVALIGYLFLLWKVVTRV